MRIKAIVHADQETADFPHFWETVFGSERPFMVLREDILRQYKSGRDELGFQYVRAHGIFHDEMGVYRELLQGEKKRVVYNWRAVDRVYDQLLSIDLRPFVELSFMPRQLASDSQTCFHWQGNVTPPKDYAEWEKLVQAFVQHLVDRYGLDEVRRWYFEVWNEPNLSYFWAGSREDYWRLYDYAAAAVKAVDHKLKVGGPATAAGAWVDEFVHHCLRGRNYLTNAVGSPMDFVSYHGYPTDAGLVLGGEKITFLSSSYWRDMARRNHRYVREGGKPVEIHVTEWNSTANGRDPRHDDSNQAAFICQMIKDVEGYVNTYAYWTLSDIFEEMGWPEAEFHGGFGLITMNGICKPAYNAFKVLHMLGDRRLRLDFENAPGSVDGLATVTERGIQILLWSYLPPGPDGGQDLADEIHDGQGPRTFPVMLQVKGVGDRRFNSKQYRIDRQHSNAFTAWKEMGSPAHPGEEQLQQLRRRMGLEMVRFEHGLRADGETLALELVLSPASVTMMILETE